MTLSLLRPLIAFSACLVLAACATQPAPHAADEPPIVLMIGLDGLRADAIDRWDAPNLQALAARGVRAERMVPVMPSKTFVNFYTLATGLYPEHHGMISNKPYDRTRDEIFSNQAGSRDAFWWQGEPIWITAETQGLRSAIMFWPGSEAAHDGVLPTEWRPYEHGKPYEERVAELLAWFDAPVAEQPRLAAIYFDHVDSITHVSGPMTAEEGEAVARVDALVGALVEGLRQRGVLERATIIVVSDHGMLPISNTQAVALDDLADLDGLFIPEFAGRFGAGLDPFVMGYGEPEVVERVYRALDGANPHITAYRREDMPAAWHFNHPTRGPDLFVLAEPGWSITRSDADLTGDWLSGLSGNHGYDNRLPEMGATFIAAGPLFPAGYAAEPFENTNVYGLIACALDLEPAANDGDPAVLARLTAGRCPAR